MKLSEMSTEKLIDTMAEMTDYLGNIAEDEQMVGLFNKIVDNEISIGLAVVKILQIGFKKHKEDICSIVAVVNQEDIEDVKKQNGLKTMIKAKEIFMDKEFINFFKELKA